MSEGCESYRRAERRKSAEQGGWQVSRRGLISTVGIGMVGWLARPSAIAQAIFSGQDQSQAQDILVNVFLRGGMDGLSAVVPYREDDYHRARPNLRLRSPRDGSAGEAAQCLDLDGRFGLHPAMASLYPHFREGRMAVVHAVGSGDQTRSHFEAMNAMERGMFQVGDESQTGWISRHFATSSNSNPTPLRAVSISSTTPDSLRGASHATTLETLDDFKLLDPGMRATLTELYGSGKDAVSVAGRNTLDVLKKLNGLDHRTKSNAYPNSNLARGLSQVAHLIRANVGLEVACLEMGGWDTHVAQGTTSGWLPGYLKELADALAAFVGDMGADMSRITVIVQTEFGRRLHENTGLGTDHGRASAMFLLGGGVMGGKVYADWPGLGESQLDEVGDLKVTTDYRNVLGEALAKRVPNSDPQRVFSNWTPQDLGIFRSNQ